MRDQGAEAVPQVAAVQPRLATLHRVRRAAGRQDMQSLPRSVLQRVLPAYTLQGSELGARRAARRPGCDTGVDGCCAQGKKKAHKFTLIKEELVEGYQYCAECKVLLGTEVCDECNQHFCDACRANVRGASGSGGRSGMC